MDFYTLDHLPKAHTTYTKLIKSLLPKIANQLDPKNLSSSATPCLPALAYEVKQIIIKAQHLASYRHICGFEDDGNVPALYYAVLSQSIQMHMMAHKDFPFLPLGLVHTQNTLTQYRPIHQDEKARLLVRFGNLSPHSKGWQVEFVTQIFVDDELVCSNSATYLSLSRQKLSHSSKSTPPLKLATTKDSQQQPITLPKSLGKRYARISGDFNPIHLHALSARVFGYPQAIAHGMYTKAKVLSCLPLPQAYTCHVAFKSPIFLPSQVSLVYTDNLHFGVYHLKSNKTHLIGEVQTLTP